MRFYVVWVGREPGIYSTWPECESQVKGFPRAKYRGYDDELTARAAFEAGHDVGPDLLGREGELFPRAIAVQAEVSATELGYVGVGTDTGNALFRVNTRERAPADVAEFLGVCHALALNAREGVRVPVYCSSDLALRWVRNKRCGMDLAALANARRVRELVERAEHWLSAHELNNPVLKWDHYARGAIPGLSERNQ